eukprot:scaffold102367_cov39-Tisochrysis_lutea.AAC.2
MSRLTTVVTSVKLSPPPPARSSAAARGHLFRPLSHQPNQPDPPTGAIGLRAFSRRRRISAASLAGIPRASEVLANALGVGSCYCHCEVWFHSAT